MSDVTPQKAAPKNLVTLIFADGASSGNPGPGGWGAVIAQPDGRITELGGSDPETTNNRMEMTGVIRALVRLERDSPDVVEMDVLTDSVYVIRGITQWIWGWQKNGWKTKEGKEVTNQDLWKKLAQLVRGKKIEWKFVRGHAGIPGNERCDEIAVAFSKGRPISLYQGSLLQYDVAIHDLPESFEIPESANRPREVKAPAFSYLSLVNGKLHRDQTWAQCEARVKGRPGAKFKKATSAADEAKILEEWGYSASALES